MKRKVKIKSDDILLSVVLPVYNGERFLKAAIDSVLNQTYTTFELIILNDGSSDDTSGIVKEFIDDRIVLIEHKNMGFARTLNEGINKSRGKYIVRMDHDDICHPDRFRLQLDFMERHSDVCVLSGAIKYIDENGRDLGRSFPLTSCGAIRLSLLTKGCVIVHPAAMMRTREIRKIGGYSEDIRPIYTDYHLWIKLTIHGHKISNLPNVLLHYRLLSTSMSSNFSNHLSPKAISTLVNLVKNGTKEGPRIYDRFYAECGTRNIGLKRRRARYDNVLNRVYKRIHFISKEKKEIYISSILNFLRKIGM